MLLPKLFKAPEFSKEEYAILNFLWKAYLEFDGKYASFLYCLMDKMPENGEPLDLSNLKVKWIEEDGSGIMGAFNPLFPKTIFITNTAPTMDCVGSVNSTPTENRYMRLDLVTNNLLMAFPIVMHELYHMLQFKTSKVGYTAMRFVSIFTTIPYYLFQNAEWMPTFRKAFVWDIEGQAEKYGNLAPHIEEFCHGLEMTLNAYTFHANTIKSIKRDELRGELSRADLEDRKYCCEKNLEIVLNDYSPTVQKKGKELFDLLKKLAE